MDFTRGYLKVYLFKLLAMRKTALITMIFLIGIYVTMQSNTYFTWDSITIHQLVDSRGKRNVMEELQDYEFRQEKTGKNRKRMDKFQNVHVDSRKLIMDDVEEKPTKLQWAKEITDLDMDSRHDAKSRHGDYIIYEREYVASLNRFRVGEAKLQFLKEFQSPCWLENTTDKHPYKKSNLMQKSIDYKKKLCFEKGLRDKSKAAFIKLPNLDRPYRLRCLPYFMYIGFAKCGSTDFQSRATVNKYMVRGFTKEFYWWDQFRFTANSSLSDYSDILDSSLQRLSKLKVRGYKRVFFPGATGEMTTVTMYSMAYWRQDPRNYGLKEPKYLTQHDIHSIVPNVKLIVMMRNPVSRLYSHYNMWAPYREYSVTPDDFHQRVVASINWWHNCTRLLPVRGCLYGSPPEVEPVEYELGSWWPDETYHSGEIRSGMYYLFLKDWFDVFPRKNFLILRTEDFKAEKVKTLNNKVYPFLHIPPVTDKINQLKLEMKEEAFKQTYEPMLNETKRLLEKFYQPYSDKLAQLLNDNKWSWRDSG